jgi:hypothetical protein
LILNLLSVFAVENGLWVQNSNNAHAYSGISGNRPGNHRRPMSLGTRETAAHLALRGADDLGCVAARQLAAIEHSLQNSSRFRWKILFLARFEPDAKCPEKT